MTLVDNMACSDQINTTDLENAKVDAITIAEVANSRTGGTAGGALIDETTTRFLEPVSTLRGQLAKLGYEVPIAYTTGISFTVDDGAKTVDEGGIIYAPRIDTLPFTTTGTWATDSSNFYVIQNSSVLSNYIVETYAELEAIPAKAAGNVITVTGEGIAGDFVLRNVVAHGLSSNNDVRVIDADWYAKRLDVNFVSGSVINGYGVNTTPQPNSAFQSVRDHTVDNGFSIHGFIVSDYFAIDTNAMNSFGSDVEVGDGTQGASFQLNHLHDFQSRDIIELGAGGMSQHATVITFDELRSGTVQNKYGALFVDLLGQYDTPGLAIPNFEVNGAAQVNNQTGIRTTIKHGLNPRSAHFSAGVNDSGAAINSGGAPVDIECPTVIRQVQESSNQTTGALVLTAGGIGCSGNVNAGTEVSASGINPIIRLKNDAQSQLGFAFHNGTDMSIKNAVAGDLNLGTNNIDKVSLKTDRLIPENDDDLFLGDSTHRWKQLFAITATIHTSDVNTKDNIVSIDDKLLDAWGGVNHCLFQWKDALSEKGEGARIHAGFIAQEVQKALEDAGIDGFKYGLLCEDDLTEKVTKTRIAKRVKMETVSIEKITFENIDGKLIRVISTEEIEQPVIEQMQVFNEDGTPYLVETTEEVTTKKIVDGKEKVLVESIPVLKPLFQGAQVTEDYEEEYTDLVKTGKKRMGLRYTECLVVESAYLRREIQRLKEKSKKR